MASRYCTAVGFALRCACALALLWTGAVNGGRIREVVCAQDQLSFECASRKSVIVVYRAYVTTDLSDVNVTCSSKSGSGETNLIESESFDPPECYDDLRIYVNKRCSGSRKCSYSYLSETARKCNGRNMAIVVDYECVRESTIHKYCNTRLRLKEGYIASPGYPQFYPRLPKCRWDLEAADGYKIVVQPLHFHLRPPTITHYDEEYPIRAGLHPDEKHCDVDFLRIEEGGVRLVDLCGENLQNLSPLQLEASKGVSIQFTSKGLFPGSGFLLHIKIKGCPTLSPPEDVEFLGRNGSEAAYRCQEDLVFNDTLENGRVLMCVGEHRWNDTLHMPCIDPEDAIRFELLPNSAHNSPANSNKATLNRTKVELENMTINDQALGPPVPEKRTSYIEDIVVPSILMSLLVVGNAIIIFIIFAVRRRHERKRKQEEEEKQGAEKQDGDAEERERLNGPDAAMTNNKDRPLGLTTTV